VKGYAVTGPVDTISNPVRQIDSSIQGEAYHASVIVIKTGIVGRYDGIVFRHPLQFFGILHPTRHYRIGIHGSIGGG
jgi:hypothetical protein